MANALKETHIYGIKTNRSFLQAILADSVFQNFQHSTQYLSEEKISTLLKTTHVSTLMTTGLLTLTEAKQNAHNSPIQKAAKHESNWWKANLS